MQWIFSSLDKVKGAPCRSAQAYEELVAQRANLYWRIDDQATIIVVF